MRRICFGRSGEGHLEVDRGGQDGDTFDTVIVEIGQGAVEGAFPVVSLRLRGFEMTAEERMLTCGDFARDHLRRFHPESFALPWVGGKLDGMACDRVDAAPFDWVANSVEGAQRAGQDVVFLFVAS